MHRRGTELWKANRYCISREQHVSNPSKCYNNPQLILYQVPIKNLRRLLVPDGINWKLTFIKLITVPQNFHKTFDKNYLDYHSHLVDELPYSKSSMPKTVTFASRESIVDTRNPGGEFPRGEKARLPPPPRQDISYRGIRMIPGYSNRGFPIGLLEHRGRSVVVAGFRTRGR